MPLAEWVLPMIKVIGISDPLVQPSGFGRVARELFQRLPRDKFDLAYLSRGWIGSRRYDRVTCYSADASDEVCSDAFPIAAADFAGRLEPFILWTLTDPWQIGWLSHPLKNALSTPRSRHFMSTQRQRFKWIGHFPVDGKGAREGPPLWFEDFLNGPDHTVFMSRWGQELCSPLMNKPHSCISHAVNTSVMFPAEKEASKKFLEKAYVQRLTAMAAAAELAGEKPPTPEELERKQLKLEGNFVVGVVMANRERKYWPTVLRAFKAFKEKVPNARLIALCGDREGLVPDSWPLVKYAEDIGLKVDYAHDDPDVWFLTTVGTSFDDEDQSMRLFYSAMDVLMLISGGEGFGLPQLEGHACGVPVIVGHYSGSIELAVDERELVLPRDFYFVGNNMIQRPIYGVRDLVDKLTYAYRNVAWRQEVAAKGLIQARERSWEAILPLWVELFEKVADNLGSEPKGPAIQIVTPKVELPTPEPTNAA